MMNNDETYDEMMMKPMMKLGEDCFKMFSAHDRLLGPRRDRRRDRGLSDDIIMAVLSVRFL